MREEGKGAVRAGTRLPALTMPGLSGERAVDLRAGSRDARVLLLLDEVCVQPFLGYLQRLAEALPAFRTWNGRVLVVLRASDSVYGPDVRALRKELLALEQEPALRILRDETGATRAWSDAAATAIVADRFGDVYFTAGATPPDELPTPDALEEWLRFLATQCPECGVPDEPGLGEWEPSATE
jgi:hypothetical protein